MADVFQALSDETRRLVVDELSARNDLTLFEICPALAHRGVTSSRQAISQHLTVLADAGLLRTWMQGRTKIHHLDLDPLRRAVTRWPPDDKDPPMPRIAVTSVYVDDQERALDFYTRTLGFAVKQDIPLGEFRWLTVVDPQAPDGTELVLEPDAHPAVQAFKSALVADGIPLTFFTVADLRREHAELVGRGVQFLGAPTPVGPNLVAVFDDTCGNLIQLVQVDGAD